MNTLGEDVVWIEYEAAVSMHRVRTTHAQEQRLARWASPGIADNRTSSGCVNVPVALIETHVRPHFLAHRGVVYVLPERKPLHEAFAGLYAGAIAEVGAPAPASPVEPAGASTSAAALDPMP